LNLSIGLDDLKDKINKLDNLDKSDLGASLDKLYKDLRILDEEWNIELTLFLIIFNLQH